MSNGRLALTRRPGEVILMGTDEDDMEIEVTVMAIIGNQVKLSISAPKEITILRGELKERARQGT